MKMTLVFVQVFLILYLVAKSKSQIFYNGDCTAIRMGAFNTTQPCPDTTGEYLVRNVECADNKKLHICCRHPVRRGMQTNSQRWFWVFTQFGKIISSSCTKRILCEQACLEGLNFKPISHFPQALSEYTQEDQGFVKAHMLGESLSCYNNSFGHEMQYHAGENTCKLECNNLYLDCSMEMRNSPLINFYFRSANIVHSAEMFVITVAIAERNFIIEASKIIVKAMVNFFDRIREIKNIFYNALTQPQWRETDVQKRSIKKRSKLLWKALLN